MAELLCNWFYAYVAGRWAWISERNMAPGQSGRRCALPYGHDANHAMVGGLGHEVPRATSDALRERAREMPGAVAARRRVYAEDERRRAAKALDAYMIAVFGGRQRIDDGAAWMAARDDFVEAVGDYVVSRLQQKSHYGVVVCRAGCRPDMPCDAERHVWEEACPRPAAHMPSERDGTWPSAQIDPTGYMTGDGPVMMSEAPTYRAYNPSGEPAARRIDPSYRAYNPQDPSTHPPTCGCPVCVQ